VNAAKNVLERALRFGAVGLADEPTRSTQDRDALPTLQAPSGKVEPEECLGMLDKLVESGLCIDSLTPTRAREKIEQKPLDPGSPRVDDGFVIL